MEQILNSRCKTARLKGRGDLTMPDFGVILRIQGIMPFTFT